ncbi:unnamed protein product, partial [marine sediment metagenome]
SAAPLLLAAGTPGHRWVAANTFFMHHQGVDEIEGQVSSLKADLKHMEALDNTWTRLLAGLSNKPIKWWDDRAKKAEDFYFSAEDAIEWGLADSIWNER